jgi:hypothetical protein
MASVRRGVAHGAKGIRRLLGLEAKRIPTCRAQPGIWEGGAGSPFQGGLRREMVHDVTLQPGHGEKGEESGVVHSVCLRGIRARRERRQPAGLYIYARRAQQHVGPAS